MKYLLLVFKIEGLWFFLEVLLKFWFMWNFKIWNIWVESCRDSGGMLMLYGWVGWGDELMYMDRWWFVCIDGFVDG